MGNERTRTRVRCKVDDYPEEARRLLDEMLLDVRYTYADIAIAMTEAGYPITKSSVHRYAMRTEAAAARIRAAAEQTKALITALQDNHDVEASEVASSLLLDGLTRRLATADEEYEKLSIDKAGRLLVQLQRSGVYKNRYKEERQKTIDNLREDILSQIRDQVQGDDELLARLSGMVQDAARREADRIANG